MLRKTMLAALATGTVLVFGVGPQAFAATAPSGVQSTATSGGVQFGAAAKDVTPFTTVNVGGGTWVYNVTRNLLHLTTTVTSDYINNEYTHTATAVAGTVIDTTSFTAPYYWADAKAVSGYLVSAAMYWDNVN
ncbi:MAG: lactococcin 972 family bacteriocin [Bacilli bacterium]